LIVGLIGIVYGVVGRTEIACVDRQYFITWCNGTCRFRFYPKEDLLQRETIEILPIEIEITLLKKIFAPEETRIASLLMGRWKPVATIANRIGLSEEPREKKLRS